MNYQSKDGPKAEFGSIAAADFEETIREDVRILKEQQVLQRSEIRGLALDLEDDTVRVVR